MSEDVTRYRKPKILRQLAVGSGRHAVIEASAGTGKTYTLEHLVVEVLLSCEITIGQLLLVTFTEKAAGELKARVRGLLEKLLNLKPADEPVGVPDEECWRIDPAARQRLARALRELSSATICTIHAFCRQVLTENAFVNGRLFSEELAESREQLAAALRDLLRTEFATDPELRALLTAWLEAKSLEQLESLLYACQSRGGRIVPEFDLGQVGAALKALPPRERALAVCEFVHGGSRNKVEGMLRGLYDAVEAAARPELGEMGRFAALTRIHRAPSPNWKESPVDYLPAPLSKAAAKSALIPGLVAAIEGLGQAVIPLEPAVAQVFLPRLEARLARRKREAGLFDFQDMLSLVRDSLEGPQGPQLLKILRDRFRFALIDECQDTDEIQWQIFRKIFVESPESRPLYLIGDPKQAIYGFRGADVQTYLEARDELRRSDASVVALTENFRSTEPLVAAYNRILEQESGFFSGDIQYDQPVSCGDRSLALLDSRGKPLAPVQMMVVPTESVAQPVVLSKLGPAIAAEIRRLVESPQAPRWRDGKGERRLRYRDIFILGRAAADGMAMAQALREAGVPFAFYKQDGLFQTSEARDVEDLLFALADPEDRGRRLRAWMTPFFGLRLGELSAVAELPESAPWTQRLLEWSRLARARNPEHLFRALLEDSGLVRRLILCEPGERALTNYLHLFEILREQLASRGASAEEMARALRSWREETRRPVGENTSLQRLETDRDAVQLLTMHAAKGLEAPVVFLVGGYFSQASRDVVKTIHVSAARRLERVAWVGDLPSANAEIAQQEARQEDERLLYVALTRAKARLYLPLLSDAAPEGEGWRPASPPKLNGCWGKVNRRLCELFGEASPEPATGGRFSFVVIEEPRQDLVPSAHRAGAAIEIPPALLEMPADARWEELAARHAGFTTTSFTQLRDRLDTRAEAVKSETLDHMRPPENELPGGAAAGSFLHEILARVPPEKALQHADPETFAEDAEVARIFDGWRRRFGIESRHLPSARRLVHTALTAPVALEPGVRIEGLARSPRLQREMDFLYPIPERSHPKLGQALERRGFEIRRGFVIGFVDLLFEHHGRIYLADWKSNCLPSFDPQRVEAEVRHSYWLQAQLYLLALVKMLGIRGEQDYQAKVGGVAFLFLRGLQRDGDGSTGVFFSRPGWSEVVAWEEELRQMKELSAGGEA